MVRFLYWIVEQIAKVHTYLLSLNDSFEYVFSDKELHFIVIGIIGMLMIQSNMGRLSITGFSGYCMFFSSLTVIAVLIAMIISLKLERK